MKFDLCFLLVKLLLVILNEGCMLMLSFFGLRIHDNINGNVIGIFYIWIDIIYYFYLLLYLFK